MLLGTMLHVHVPVKLSVREEAFVADVAMPRVLLKVASVMSGELRGLHKRATTHIANEVFLVSVNSLVYC